MPSRFSPHFLNCLSNLFINLACVIEELHLRETNTFWIACFSEKGFGFREVFFNMNSWLVVFGPSVDYIVSRAFITGGYIRDDGLFGLRLG